MTNVLKSGVLKLAMFVLIGMAGTFIVSNLMSSNSASPAQPASPSITLQQPTIESNSVYQQQNLAGGLSGNGSMMDLMNQQRQQFGEVNSKGAIVVFIMFGIGAAIFLFTNISKGALKARMLKKEFFKEPIDYDRASETHLANMVKTLTVAAGKDGKNAQANELLNKYILELEEVRANRQSVEGKRIYKKKTN